MDYIYLAKINHLSLKKSKSVTSISVFHGENFKDAVSFSAFMSSIWFYLKW